MPEMQGMCGIFSFRSVPFCYLISGTYHEKISVPNINFRAFLRKHVAYGNIIIVQRKIKIRQRVGKALQRDAPDLHGKRYSGYNIPHLSANRQVLIYDLHAVFFVHKPCPHTFFQQGKQIVRIGKRMVKPVADAAEQYQLIRAQLQRKQNAQLHICLIFPRRELPHRNPLPFIIVPDLR